MVSLLIQKQQHFNADSWARCIYLSGHVCIQIVLTMKMITGMDNGMSNVAVAMNSVVIAITTTIDTTCILMEDIIYVGRKVIPDVGTVNRTVS